MTTASVATLVLIAMAAVLAPILSELTGRLAIPEIVIQIGLGILIGPTCFNLAHVGNVVTGLSDLGLTYLIFLAGYELDLQKIRGTPLRLATGGWAISLAIGLAAAFALVSAGLARDTVVVGLALTTTAMGTLAPILRDAGVSDTRFGAYISAIGTVGEFGPVVAVALLLTNKEPRAHVAAAGGVHRRVGRHRPVCRPGPTAAAGLPAQPASRVECPAPGPGVAAVHRAAGAAGRDAGPRRASRARSPPASSSASSPPARRARRSRRNWRPSGSVSSSRSSSWSAGSSSTCTSSSSIRAPCGGYRCSWC